MGSKLLFYVKLIFFLFLCVFISPLFFLFLHPFTLKISVYFKIFSPLFLADVPTISLHLLLLLVQKNFYPTTPFKFVYVFIRLSIIYVLNNFLPLSNIRGKLWTLFKCFFLWLRFSVAYFCYLEIILMFFTGVCSCIQTCIIAQHWSCSGSIMFVQSWSSIYCCRILFSWHWCIDINFKHSNYRQG